MQAQLDEFYIDNEEASRTKKISTKQKFLNFCKKFITFLVSRIGLMIVMVKNSLLFYLIFNLK